MKIWHVICNPAARKGHAAEIYRMIRGWADSQKELKLVLHMTATATDATDITKELTNTNEDVYILIIGGDGTISEVLNGIVNFEHTFLMILPFGSGNDFVFSLGLPNKKPIEYMIDYYGKTKVRKVNYLLINNKYRAINSTGFGISSRTLILRNKMRIGSPWSQYHRASIKASLFWKKYTFWASFDNKPEIKINTMWFVGTNGKRIGAKVISCPDALIDDGYLDVMYIDAFPRIHTIGVLKAALKGNIKQIKYAHFVRCKEFTLVLDDETVEIDGNLYEHLNALNVKIGSEHVNIVVPDYEANKKIIYKEKQE